MAVLTICVKEKEITKKLASYVLHFSYPNLEALALELREY